MTIFWSNFASEMVKDIYNYYKTNASPRVANRIRNQIFSATDQLKKYPFSGQVEISLQKLNEGHRYIVNGNYKIIYKEVKEGILITDVFDTRQDSIKINNPKRKT